jgi:hypothetical protein
MTEIEESKEVKNQSILDKDHSKIKDNLVNEKVCLNTIFFDDQYF